MAASKVYEVVDNLPKSANKTEDLQQIKILASQFTRRGLSEIISNISFNVIFECLDTEDEAQLSECCDVLRKLLGAAEASILLSQFHEDLMQGLGHPSEHVRLLCLQQTQNIADNCPQELAQHTDVLKRIIDVISEKSLHVAKKAGLVLMTLGTYPEAVEFLFTGVGLQGLQNLANEAEDVRFRLYELVTDVARLSPQNLALCSSSGLLQKLVNEVHKDDILVQLNCLELLTRLATVTHGLTYLEEHGIMGRLHQMLQGVDNDPMAGFLLPGLVKFFGAVAFVQPKEVCRRHPSFLPRAFSMCGSAEVAERVLGAETIGLLGSTVDGKHLLEQHESSMASTCRLLGELLKEQSNDVKVRGLEAIQNLIRLRVPDQTTDLLALTYTWYTRLAPDPLGLFLNMLEKPFNNVRCAVYAIFVTIATQSWGQTQFKDHATFCEFLLNRSTETCKEGKEAKFEVIKELVASPTSVEMLGRVYLVKLKEYVKEGPFFVLAESAVAMDSET